MARLIMKRPVVKATRKDQKNYLHYDEVLHLHVTPTAAQVNELCKEDGYLYFI